LYARSVDSFFAAFGAAGASIHHDYGFDSVARRHVQLPVDYPADEEIPAVCNGSERCDKNKEN
jgi:hypothetical protein